MMDAANLSQKQYLIIKKYIENLPSLHSVKTQKREWNGHVSDTFQLQVTERLTKKVGKKTIEANRIVFARFEKLVAFLLRIGKISTKNSSIRVKFSLDAYQSENNCTFYP